MQKNDFNPKVSEKKTASKNAPLDTLAQLKTNNLKKRARSKWYTRLFAGGLIQLDTPLKQYYRNAFYCNEILIQHGKEIKSANKYCNTRVCNVCNRIRTAKLTNQYADQLKQMEGLQFVTLTVVNVTAENLPKTLANMDKSWFQIRQLLSKRRGIKLSGIKKSECTYNAITDTYHPHFHIVVNGHAETIVNEWLKRNPTASIKGQNIRSVDQNSFNELFKYTTKILDRQKRNLTVYVKALDIIMRSYSKKRTVQPFGIVKMVDEDITEKDLQTQVYEVPEYDYMEWTWVNNDWVNEYGEFLTGYIPPEITINQVFT